MKKDDTITTSMSTAQLRPSSRWVSVPLRARKMPMPDSTAASAAIVWTRMAGVKPAD